MFKRRSPAQPAKTGIKVPKVGALWDERATKALQKQGFTIGGTLGGEDGLVPRRCLDRNGRHVVIRICKRGDDAEIKARRLLPVSHHGIEDVIEIRQAGPEKVAIVSRWVESTNLAVILAGGRALEPGELATLLDQAATALAYLHENRLVHGDISPANVLVLPDGSVKLIDLLTAYGQIGTRRYTPPEGAYGGHSAAGDVYSLGVVLQEAAGDYAPPRLSAITSSMCRTDPAERISARTAAARAAELGVPQPIRRGNADALAANALRDRAVREPTRYLPRAMESRKRYFSFITLAVVAALAVGVGVWLPHSGWLDTDPAPVVSSSATLDADADPRVALQSLASQRDQAIMGLDDKKMAAVSEPGSTVAKDDANLMSQLKAKNVKITGLKTTLDDFTAVAVPEHLASKYPGAQAWRARVTQSATTRTENGQSRQVDAPEPKYQTFVLLSSPWRLVEVY